MTHRSNETNEKKFDINHKKSPKAPIREYTNIHNNVNKKRVTVIGDSMVKFVKSENLSVENYIANIRSNPDCTIEDIADYKTDYQKKTRYYTSPHWHKRSYKQCKYNE